MILQDGLAWRAGGHGKYHKIHFDRPHQQAIFTSVGGSASAYALSPPGVYAVSDAGLPDYVPVWRPPPPRTIIDEAPTPRTGEEEPVVAHDWGHLFRGAAEGFLGGIMQPPPQTTFPVYMTDPGEVGPVERVATAAVSGGLGAESCEGMVWTGGVPPKGFKVVNFCGQGVLRKVRRRRRRRLLTASDKADISYIVATTGKGQLAASLIHRSAQ